MFTKENCRFSEKNRELRAVIEDYDKGKINLNPWFQRDFKNKIRSSIIESILLNFPIARIYLMKYIENGASKYYVIDGKQRLATIISFYKGVELDSELNETGKKFKCANFDVLKELNGLSYKDFAENYQEDFLQYSLAIIEVEVIGDGVNHNEVLEYIFEKVNTTSKALTKIEIQNCIYSGELFKKLKFISMDKNIKSWFGIKPSKNDIINFLLQFICIISKNYDNKNISNSVNRMLDNNYDDINFAEKWSTNVVRIFRKGVEIFNPEILIHDNRPLLKTYLLIAYFNIENLHTQLMRHKDELINNFIDLFSAQNWKDVAIQWTTRPDNIRKRIMYSEHILEDILEKYDIKLDQKRVFDCNTKQLLYTYNQCCKICNQKIDRINEAHVDHVIPWSLGGETTIENAQLSHRTCNISKGNKVKIR